MADTDVFSYISPDHNLRSAPESPRSLGLKWNVWRPHQRELVEQILDLKTQTALIEAPTGFGKSTVAAALALLIPGRIIILTHTKSLQEQYLRDFPFMKSLQGKDEYACILPGSEKLPVSQAPCQTGWTCHLAKECPYFVQHRVSRSSRVIVTNYAKALSSYLGDCDLLICDEGHLLERQVISANSIRLNYQEMKEADISVPPFGSIQEAADWAAGKLPILEGRLLAQKQILVADPQNKTGLKARYMKLKQVINPLRSLSNADTDALWSIEPYRKTLILRPLWASSHTGRLFSRAKKVVIQSATILDGKRLAGLLGLRDQTYIQIPSNFPAQRRPIFYWPAADLRMSSPPEEHDKLIAAIDKVIDLYPKRRGIIHSVNMTLTEEIGRRSKHAQRLIVQGRGKKRREAIDTFLRTPYAVLVSPSVMTGLDGRFEVARFQIIAKVPFEDQGEKAISERLEQDEQWYAYQTAFNLQQAAGRVMRDRWDYGETWILDENFSWFSKHNWGLFSEWFKEALQKREL